MAELEDVYDVEAYAREHKDLIEHLIFMQRSVPFGKFVVTYHEGKIVTYEIQTYERKIVGMPR